MKRYARLTNAHSKKLLNHRCATALHFVWYNFAKVHSTKGCTPAMAAGLESHPWPLEKLIALAN